MTNEELDFLFDLLREERRLYEGSLKPNKYRLYNLSLDTKKKYRKQLKLSNQFIHFNKKCKT